MRPPVDARGSWNQRHAGVRASSAAVAMVIGCMLAGGWFIYRSRLGAAALAYSREKHARAGPKLYRLLYRLVTRTKTIVPSGRRTA